VAEHACRDQHLGAGLETFETSGSRSLAVDGSAAPAPTIDVPCGVSERPQEA
jgi:hypothetical protein